MRLDRLLLLSSLLFAAPACGDGSVVASADSDTSAAEADHSDDDSAADVAPDAVDALVDSAPDTTRPDTAVAGPKDVFDPQPDAWATIWTRTIEATDARVVAMRYVGANGETPGLLALIEVGAGAAALTDADGDSEALAGDEARIVIANLNPTSGAVVASSPLNLAAGESLGHVSKGPNGFAFAIDRAGVTGRIVLAQLFGGVLRASVVTIDDEADSSHLGLPAGGDLGRNSTGGATTALALQLDAPAGAVLHIAPLEKPDAGAAVGLTTLPVTTGIGFLTLAAPTAELAYPIDGSGVVIVPDLIVGDVLETTLGPVVSATVLAATSIRTRDLAAGDHVLLIGALPDAVATDEPVTDPSIPVVLWQGAGPGLDVVQIASAGGGLVLAGVGSGALTFGEETRELAATQGFVASLGSSGGFLYTAPECGRILSLSAGFALRIMRLSCDEAGQGPALMLTLVGASEDLGGDPAATLDLLMVPLAPGAQPTALSGLLSFSVSDGRAYGGLFDFGEGPRVVLVREDGQFYDSGVLPLLARSGASDAPLFFMPLRQGGGGGGNSALINAVVFAVPQADGPVIGRGRLDLQTYIR